MRDIVRKKKILIVFILFLFLCTGCSFQNKEYTMNLYYMDTYIYVKFYSRDKNLSLQVKEEIEKIYKEYHQLTDRYQSYEGIFNVYDIYHNEEKSDILTLDSKLYELLDYSDNFQEKTEGLFTIDIGAIVDVWKKYRDQGYGLPTKQELKKANNKQELVLLGNNQIKNNHPNLDLGAISKGYATQKVGEYLKSVGITEYLINAGGNVLVGTNPEKDTYRIGIQGPNKDGTLVTVVNGSNISVVTSGSYERNYVYQGKTYSHIIDPNSLYPADKLKSVTVITFDSALGDLLSTTLFLMDIEEGLEFIKEYDAEVIWVTNEDEIIRSEGFSAYES